jgi:acyl-CoA thioesterase YciA
MESRAEQVTLPEEDPILRLVPMPTDTNYAGDVFGGWIMAQVDIAGSLPAIRRARGRVATVAVNSRVQATGICKRW